MIVRCPGWARAERARSYGVLVGVGAGAPPEPGGAGAKIVGPDGFTRGVPAGAAGAAAGRGVGVRDAGWLDWAVGSVWA